MLFFSLTIPLIKVKLKFAKKNKKSKNQLFQILGEEKKINILMKEKTFVWSSE